LYKKEDATKGKFAFTTDDYDMYKVCVESEGRPSQSRIEKHILSLYQDTCCIQHT